MTAYRYFFTSILLLPLISSSLADSSSTCGNAYQPGSDSGDCESPVEQVDGTPGNSIIWEGQQTLEHIATDYDGEGVQAAIPSCGSCTGSTGSSSSLPSLKISRIFVSRPSYYHFAEFGYPQYLSNHYGARLITYGADELMYTNHDNSRNRLKLVYDPARQGWVDVADNRIYGAFLYNASGSLIVDPSLRDTATSVTLLHHDGRTEHHDFYFSSHENLSLYWRAEAAGTGYSRLTSLMDRNGNAITMTYELPIPASNKVQYVYDYSRRDKIIDAYGRTASFEYNRMVKSGYVWSLIKTITLPNGEKIHYTQGLVPGFKPRALQSVQHPDGSQSTFSSVADPALGRNVFTINDSSAPGYSRHKTAYLQSHVGVNSNGQTVNQIYGMVRKIVNHEGEIKYQNRMSGDGSIYLIHKGGNKVDRFWYSNNAIATIRQVDDPAILDDFLGYDMSQLNTTSGNLKPRYQRSSNNKRSPLVQNDAQDRTIHLTRDPLTDKILTQSGKDGIIQSYIRNPFTQILQRTDKLGRITLNTYSPTGNLLTTTSAFGTPEASTISYLHNTRGQIIEQRDALYDPNLPELHNTQFQYNTSGYLIKKIESADTAGGARPETTMSYDAAGRLATITDPLGRLTSFTYDTRSRLVKTTYNDTSYQEVTYGTGVDANLIVSIRDRNGITTNNSYDTAARITQSQTVNHQSQIIGETNNTYLSGTHLKTTSTINGETTTYQYDYNNRLTQAKTQANSQTLLTTTRELDFNDRLRSSTDAYGRKTYYLYDQNDRVIKTITETVPQGLTNVPALSANYQTTPQTSAAHNYILTDLAGNNLETDPNNEGITHKVTYTDPRDLYLESLVRDNTITNHKYLITNSVFDAEGQILIHTDARGNSSWTEYDALGRTTLSIQAVGTPAEIRSEQDYDDNSNVVETRSPRHFTEGPGTTANITGVGKDSYTYNGRNMRSTHTTAVGSTEAQTQSWTYLLDGRSDEHTDFRGNIAKSLWHACCGRLQATIQRDGTSTTIHNTDYKGQATHTAVVSANPNGNWHDPIDQDTLAETTTRFDGRGRPTHTTTWLQPLGSVDDNARVSLGDTAGIPIAGLDGIPATDGLTTTYLYDEDLTDGVGIDSTYSTQLAELTTRYGYNPFGTGANGYAVAVTNPAGETTVQVTDGAGRTILTINPEGDITTMHYDEMVTLTQPPLLATNYSLLSTKSIDALDNENVFYTDAAGRTLASKDAEGNFSYAAYNANSSVETSRDANGLGQTCEYDALNRPTTCADLQETAEGNTRTTTYNAASQALTSTNADGETTTNVYDVRSRLASTTDPNNIVTDYTYDANNNLTTLSDGKGNLRHWFFDARNLNTTKVHQGNAADAASSSDFYTQNFDALGRVSIKVDQIGTICTMNYDLAGRMTEKQYYTGATPAQGGTITPGGTLESTDTFSYDAASRLTATTKGRHNISTEHTYAADSMPLTEKLVADGRTYESTRSYDAANRPLSHIYPNGKSTYWAYTERNLVASIHYEDKLVADQSHDAGYRLTSQNYGNGLDRTISYGRQDNLRTADSVAGKQDLQMTYSYAADKQITAETIAEDVLADTSFTASYDAGNRITNWNRAGAPVNNAQSWNYDDNGNWISTTKDGVTEARNHDNTDQLTQIAGKASTNDAKGNLTAYEQNGKEYEIDYDLDNRIIKVDIDNNDVEYRYDALGRRVIRQEGTTKTALIWWGDSECAEHKHQAGQTVIQNDIMAHPSRLNSVIARAVDGSKFKLEWYHKNYLDHVYAVSDDSGDILEHYRYSAFGEVTIYNELGNQVSTTQIDNHILWNTRRRDELTGFYLYKFRHYSAELGRWLARDPIGENGGVNLYGFGPNSPFNGYDRLGLDWFMVLGIHILTKGTYPSTYVNGNQVTIITNNSTAGDRASWKSAINKTYLDPDDATKIDDIIDTLVDRSKKKCVTTLNLSGHGVSGAGVGFKDSQFHPDLISKADAAKITKTLCPNAIVNMCSCADISRSDGDRQRLATLLQRKVCSCKGSVRNACKCSGEWVCSNP